jgi:hypothetical protein
LVSPANTGATVVVAAPAAVPTLAIVAVSRSPPASIAMSSPGTRPATLATLTLASPGSAGATSCVAAAAAVPTEPTVASSSSIASLSPGSTLATLPSLTLVSPAEAFAASAVWVPGVPIEVIVGPSNAPSGSGPAPTGKL